MVKVFELRLLIVVFEFDPVAFDFLDWGYRRLECIVIMVVLMMWWLYLKRSGLGWGVLMFPLRFAPAFFWRR